MTGYKMNFATKTLTITKAFGEKASLPNTEEANIIQNMRNLLPDLKIAYKTQYRSKPHPYKGLSYSRMEKYINCHENANELLVAFKGIKEVAKAQSYPHNYVCKWFLTQFPDYKEIPTLHNDKIAAVEVVTLTKDRTIATKETDVAMAA